MKFLSLITAIIAASATMTAVEATADVPVIDCVVQINYSGGAPGNPTTVARDIYQNDHYRGTIPQDYPASIPLQVVLKQVRASVPRDWTLTHNGAQYGFSQDTCTVGTIRDGQSVRVTCQGIRVTGNALLTDFISYCPAPDIVVPDCNNDAC